MNVVVTIWKPTKANGGSNENMRLDKVDVKCAAAVCARYYKGISAHGCNAVLVGGDNLSGSETRYRIRRLTSKECWRLQGFGWLNEDGTWNDELFEKAKASGVSDTQLYRQAGNAVTRNVAYAIGMKIMQIELGKYEED